MDEISPELIEIITALGSLPEQQSELQKQIDLAQQLRVGSPLKGVQAGRTFVASNPLEGLAEVLRRRQGAMDEKKLRGQFQQNLGKMDESRKLYANHLIGGLRQPQQPTMTPETENPGMYRGVQF